ncbi:Uncharacterised protein [Mycobacteroides abscessus subsp. abscessus]|nr:Uncharacterised protein [Mycobacteroides abscessus subsp. abscessus]
MTSLRSTNWARRARSMASVAAWLRACDSASLRSASLIASVRSSASAESRRFHSHISYHLLPWWPHRVVR